jgi:hypothetical protein
VIVAPAGFGLSRIELEIGLTEQHRDVSSHRDRSIDPGGPGPTKLSDRAAGIRTGGGISNA